MAYTTREYVDGERVLVVQINDNGTVGFTAREATEEYLVSPAIVSIDVLQQILDHAKEAQVST